MAVGVAVVLQGPGIFDKLQAEALKAVGAGPVVPNQRKTIEGAIGAGDSYELKLGWRRSDAYSGAIRADVFGDRCLPSKSLH